MGIRSAMLGIGGKMLKRLINADGGDYRGRTILCEKGHDLEFEGYRTKTLLTVLAPVSVKRAYYSDKACESGFWLRTGAGYRRNLVQLRGAPDDEQGRLLSPVRSRP